MQEISETLTREQVPKLRELDSVPAFLAEFENSGKDWRSNVKLELAFARLLSGDFERGEQMVDEILQLAPDSPIIPIVQVEARRLVEESHRGAASISELVNEIKKKNLSAVFPGVTLKGNEVCTARGGYPA